MTINLKAMRNEIKLTNAEMLKGEFERSPASEEPEKSDTKVFAVVGKADRSREKKFKNRIHGSNKKYLKPYLKG
jgi:hypothetical protein